MAGETSVVRRGPEIPARTESVLDLLPLRWLRRLWLTLLVGELAGAVLALVIQPGLASGLAALATLGVVMIVGGPLFLLTWLRLAIAPGCPHRRFLLLVISWVAALLTTQQLPEQRAAVVLITLGLPIASTLEVLRGVLRAQRAEDETRPAPAADGGSLARGAT